jgi:hypothetical protein
MVLEPQGSGRVERCQALNKKSPFDENQMGSFSAAYVFDQ